MDDATQKKVPNSEQQIVYLNNVSFGRYLYYCAKHGASHAIELPRQESFAHSISVHKLDTE